MSNEVVKSLSAVIQQKKSVLESRLKLNKVDRGFEDYANDILYAVKNDEKLQECTPDSIFDAAMQAAKVGLSIGGNVASLVPYGKKCSYMIGYDGYAILLSKLCPIKFQIYDVVRKGDKFDLKNKISTDENGILKSTAIINFEPNSKKGDEITGAFAYIAMSDGNSFGIELSTKELDKYRMEWDKQQKKMVLKTSVFWTNWTVEMYSKQIMKVLRRKLCKTYAGTAGRDDIIEIIGDDENNEMKVVNESNEPKNTTPLQPAAVSLDAINETINSENPHPIQDLQNQEQVANGAGH